MPSLVDLGGSGAMPRPKMPSHIAMCVSILSAFGVSAQFGDDVMPPPV